MCLKRYFIAHNGGVKRENGSASKTILRFYIALRHLNVIKRFIICCYILFFIHFFKFMPVRKCYIAVSPKFRSLLCIWLQIVPLVQLEVLVGPTVSPVFTICTAYCVCSVHYSHSMLCLQCSLLAQRAVSPVSVIDKACCVLKLSLVFTGNR